MENQEQNPPQQEQPFVAAKQVGFNLEDIILNTNNEVSFSVPTGGIYGKVGVNTFRNAIGAHYLPHSREYVASPSIDIVRPWFKTIRLSSVLGGKTRGFDRITNKDAIILYSLANGINIDYANIFWEDIIIKLNKMKEGYGDAEPVVFKASKTSSNAERVPQGIKPRAKPGHKKHSTSLKQPSVSSKEATIGVTSEARANPQLSSGMTTFNLNEPIYSASFIIHSKFASGDDALLVSTAEADLGKYSLSIGPHVLADKTQSVSKGLETLEDLAKLVSSVQPSFKDLNSPKDDHIIVVDDSDEDEEAEKVHATTNVEIEDTLVPKSSSPSSLPTELKDLPSKFNEQTKEVKGLKKQFHELEIELPEDLKEIPSKLEDFTKTVTIEMVHAKLKTLDALPSLLKKVTNALIQFAQAIASKKTRDTNVPSAG
ncbi:hypothetical protein Tco_1182926 [Tanacetum coccineum]